MLLWFGIGSNEVNERTKLEKKLDDLWSELIKKKFDNKCAVCGARGNLQAAHIFSRKHRATRWEPDNGVCLCRRHHLYWAHTEPFEFMQLCEKLIGKERLNELETEAHKTTHYTREDLKEIGEKLCIK